MQSPVSMGVLDLADEMHAMLGELRDVHVDNIHLDSVHISDICITVLCVFTQATRVLGHDRLSTQPWSQVFFIFHRTFRFPHVGLYSLAYVR